MRDTRYRRRPRPRLDLLTLEDRLTPALLYVAPAADYTPVLNSPTQVALNTAPGQAATPAQSTTLTTDVTAFQDLGKAVAAANANGDASNTVRILPGTYTLTAALTITKDLTLIGYGTGQTTVQTGVDLNPTDAPFGTPGAPTGDARALILVARGVSFNVAALTLDGRAPALPGAPSFDTPDLIRYTDTGAGGPAASVIAGVAFQNVRNLTPPADYDGVAVNLRNGTLTVVNSTFTNIGRIGVFETNAASTLNFLGNTYTGKGAGDFIDYAVEVSNGSTANLLGNTVTGDGGVSAADQSESAGFEVDYVPGQDTAPTAVIENNELAGNRVGVIVGIDKAEAAAVTLTQNNIRNNAALGIEVPAGRSPALGAPNNFFGSAVGPVGPNNTNSPEVNATPFATTAFALTFPPPATGVASVLGQITGQVTNAGNAKGVAGAAVFLDANGNGTLDEGEVQTVTDAAGNYTFTSLVVGFGIGTAYDVRLTVPSGFTLAPTSTNPQTVTLTPASPANTANFALTAPTPTVSVTASPSPSVFGQPVTFTASVTPPAGVSSTPTGTVTFSVGGTPLPGGSDIPVNGSGVATFTTAALPVGAGQTVTAVFTSTGAGLGGASGTVTQTVNKASTTTAVTSPGSVTTTAQGSAYTVHWVVAPVSPGAGVPTGTVTFSVGGTTLGVLTLDGTGQGTFTTTALPLGSQTLTATYSGDGSFNGSAGSITVQVTPALAPVKRVFAVGSGPGGPPQVIVYNPDGTVLTQFLAYNAAFFGGVRVAVGDVTGDGIPDIVTAAGPGGGPHVRVFDGAKNFAVSSEFFAYNSAFTGGVFVAVIEGHNGTPGQVVTGAGATGGPHVRVFNLDATVAHEFFAYDPGFLGGVAVAAADVDGDGTRDIITGAGAGGGPHVKVFSGKTFGEIRSFFAYDSAFTGGVFVAAGDLNGDGKADIITGAGAGGGPHVKAFDGVTGALLDSFYAYDPLVPFGVRVAAADLDGDGRADIVTGVGPGGGPHVKGFGGLSEALDLSFFALAASFTGGVYVG